MIETFKLDEKLCKNFFRDCFYWHILLCVVNKNGTYILSWQTCSGTTIVLSAMKCAPPPTMKLKIICHVGLMPVV